nr:MULTISPECIES: PD-(D/E)XK nuclease domain-containing protein [Treponema]
MSGKLLIKTVHPCTVFIFEFKRFSNSSAEDALNQIKEKNYAAKYKTDEKKIVLIGSSFDEKTRTSHFKVTCSETEVSEQV